MRGTNIMNSLGILVTMEDVVVEHTYTHPTMIRIGMLNIPARVINHANLIVLKYHDRHDKMKLKYNILQCKLDHLNHDLTSIPYLLYSEQCISVDDVVYKPEDIYQIQLSVFLNHNYSILVSAETQEALCLVHRKSFDFRIRYIKRRIIDDSMVQGVLDLVQEYLKSSDYTTSMIGCQLIVNSLNNVKSWQN